MITLDLDELGPGVECRLEPRQGRALASSEVVLATPSPYNDATWVVKANGKVGIARIGDVEVCIRPKVEVDRLLFLLGYAISPTGWRDDVIAAGTATDLVPALAEVLWRQVERALRPGLLQGYRIYEDALPVLRGRLRETDQMRRRYGVVVPVEVRFDEFTHDIPENQILRAAVERMLRLPRVHPDVRRRLRNSLVRLHEVAPLAPGRARPPWEPTRLNLRYHNALRMAELILRGDSTAHARGGVAVNGFLLDMPAVFEDFVTVALGEHLVRRGGRARRQDRHHLDIGEAIRIRPDLVWHLDGAPVAVVDAKYKVEKPGGFPDADLYQMLAYCAALALPRGHLVYAKGNADPARHTVRNAGVEIVCHALDLGLPPSELLGQIRRLGGQIRDGCCPAPRDRLRTGSP